MKKKVELLAGLNAAMSLCATQSDYPKPMFMLTGPNELTIFENFYVGDTLSGDWFGNPTGKQVFSFVNDASFNNILFKQVIDHLELYETNFHNPECDVDNFKYVEHGDQLDEIMEYYTICAQWPVWNEHRRCYSTFFDRAVDTLKSRQGEGMVFNIDISLFEPVLKQLRIKGLPPEQMGPND